MILQVRRPQKLDKASFSNVETWISDARAVRGNDVVILMVGNKVDMAEKRAVSAQEGEQKAKELDVLFCEASAKAAVNVSQMFNKLCYSLPGMGQQPGSRKHASRTL